jgi:hypothetical protein
MRAIAALLGVSALLAACHGQATGAGAGAADTASGQDTSWQHALSSDGFINGHEFHVYCAQEQHDELAPNNPHHWVRVCVNYIPDKKRAFGPTFNGGLVTIDGLGKVHTLKYDLDPTPSGEFHVFGSISYENKVAAALNKAQTVTINGIVLHVGKAPWLLPQKPPAPVKEYNGEDQHQEGSDR